jgi:hypothetical protein
MRILRTAIFAMGLMAVAACGGKDKGESTTPATETPAADTAAPEGGDTAAPEGDGTTTPPEGEGGEAAPPEGEGGE